MEGEKVLEEEQESGPLAKKLKPNEECTSAEVDEGLNVAAVMLEVGRVTLTDNDESPDKLTHPLLVDKILEKIFKLIIDPIRETGSHRPDVGIISRDVQNFRLVCKTWRDVATDVFRKARSTMEIGGIRIIDSPDLELSQFLEAMSGSTMIPCQNYRINRSVLTPENSHLMQLFLQLCGPDMVKVDLCVHDSDLNSVFEIQSEMSHLKLQKLTTVDILTVHSDPLNRNPKNQEDVGRFIGFLLSNSENLKDFTLTYYGLSFVPIGIRKFFMQLPCTLTSINLYTRIDYLDFYLRILQKKDMKLENFEVHFSSSVPPSLNETIYKFLQGQSKTLKKLDVPTAFLTVKRTEEPIVFCQLHSLKLQMRELPISFPDRFPKLAILDLRSLTYFLSENSCMKLLSETAPSQSVTELHLSPTILGASTASKLAKCFPSVRKLYLGPDNNFGEINPLRNVFVYFPGIEELEVSMGNFQSRGFASGESFLCCIRNPDFVISQLKGDLKKFNPRRLRKTPSILLLKKLKKLVLKDCNEITFTDFAAHFIFLKMQSLEKLYIDSGFEHMSADIVRRLKNKLKILTDRI